MGVGTNHDVLMGFRTFVTAVIAALTLAPSAHAETAPSLPEFVPYPSSWAPDYTVFPYNLWQIRVTPERVIEVLPAALAGVGSGYHPCRTRG